MLDSTVATRSVLLALVLGFGSATACIDEAVLENDECLSDKDCFNNQECVITPYQAASLGGVGWCRPKDEGCVDGEQPGCACTNLAGMQCCTGTANDASGTLRSLGPNNDAGCICVLPDDSSFLISDGDGDECLGGGDSSGG